MAFKVTMPRMKLFSRLSVAALVIALIVAAWLWWNRPLETDMSEFAPADSIAYLESNSLVDVAEGIANTDAWKILNRRSEATGTGSSQTWLRRFTAWTGIGGTPWVILSRAQVAVVILDLGAREQGEVITIKPQAALLIETHTSKSRITPTVEASLKKFAEQVYGQPMFSRIPVDGGEMLVWTAQTGERQVVAIIEGSLVIVGNSERSVKTCLEVHRGQRPALRSNAELQQMRSQLSSGNALAFGFVSSAHAAQLVSLGVPLLIGRSPSGVNFNQLIASSAPKVLGAVGWSARPTAGGIEDHYLFSLQPAIGARLQPLFQEVHRNDVGLKVLPEDLQSLTVYDFSDPRATWQGIQTTLSAQLDTLSAILVTSILKSALLPYGIENPDEFLQFVGSEIMTVRVKHEPTGSLLIAQVRDEKSLRELLSKTTHVSSPGESNDAASQKVKTGYQFVSGYVLLGPDEAVRRWSQQLKDQNAVASNTLERVTHFAPLNTSANIVTYSEDVERVRSFLLATARAQGKQQAPETDELRNELENLPYAATETTLVNSGIVRKTRSAFGQFSTLIPLLFPDNKSGNN